MFKRRPKSIAGFTIDRDLFSRVLSLPQAVETDIGGNSEYPGVEARLPAKLADGPEYFQESLLIGVSSFFPISKQTYIQVKNISIVFEDQFFKSLVVSRLSSFDEPLLIVLRMLAPSMLYRCPHKRHNRAATKAASIRAEVHAGTSLYVFGVSHYTSQDHRSTEFIPRRNLMKLGQVFSVERIDNKTCIIPDR